MKVTNPATEEIIGEMAEDTPSSIEEKFYQAKNAQRSWKSTSFEERAQIILNFRDLLSNRKESLAKLLTNEIGKPITQARNELNGVLGRIQYFLEKSSAVMKDETVLCDRTNKRIEKISHEPLGTVSHISAWNYPYFISASFFIPALLTGNTVIYKPSEHSSLTGMAIHELLKLAGIPSGVFLTVLGDKYAGMEILRLPLDGVFFTGSYPTGQKIAEITSKQLIKTHLELGGKDPVYICEDVYIREAAAAVADGAFYNMGQSCCSVERIYVHEKVYEPFISFFIETVNSYILGDPLEEETYIGPLGRKSQIAFLEKQVADAKSKGGILLLGGKKPKRKGYFFEPTVIVEANASMSLMRDESFGPIVGIQKVSGDSEALELMNDTQYGLTASVFTRDPDRANHLLSQINTGTVYWNCCDQISPRLPWSGRRNSGLGTALSTYGIQAFLQPKAWHLKTL